MLVNYREIDWFELFKKYGLVERQKRQKRTKTHREVVNVICAFDIETSLIKLDDDPKSLNYHSFMYIWHFQIEDYTIKGRTWDEYFSFLRYMQSGLEKLGKEYHLDKTPQIVIWVHNLAYEFSFLSGVYQFNDDDCFFRDVRKPIYVRMFDVFEYRCSYIQTNLSLKKLCEQMKVPEKLSGQKFDYSKVRYPWTELTDFEEQYCTVDVESLVMAMKKRIAQSGDTLLTVPLTSTGYVRRECKQALQNDYLDVRDMKPRQREYALLRSAFRGGNTHANRAYVGKVLSDVYSYDIASSYPTQQLTQYFPMGQFKWLDCRLTLERLMTFIGLNYAVVAKYQFKNVRLKNKKEPIPYLSLSKCDTDLDYRIDNGRILRANYIEIAMTEVDLEIFLRQYNFDSMAIIEAMVCKKGPLPEKYRSVIQTYYNYKTSLKGDDSENGEYMYMKSKNMLNAVYGMSATDPIHQDIKYNGGDYKVSRYSDYTEKEIDDLLVKAGFPYQWGVYTTALARKQLQDAIDLCGDQLIYCDTDSVKTLGDVPIQKLNNKLKRNAELVNAYADDMKGKRHYIGLFEQDAHYDLFITQGAKRYAYDKKGKLGITVAGVTKTINEETGISFAVEELKTLKRGNGFQTLTNEQALKRFKPGMIWVKAGGTMSIFNDDDDFYYEAEGQKVHITKNVSIVPSTYEMTHTRDYAALLNEIELFGEYRESIR